MKFLRQIWKDIRQGENIDLYLTIIAAVVVSALSLMGASLSAQIPAITLAILALLAFTNLFNRHKLEEVLSKGSSTFFRKDFPEEVRTDMEKSRELWLVGVKLSRTLTTYIPILEKKLAHGDKVKVLLLDPRSEAARYSNQTLSYPMDLEQHRESIRMSINLLNSLDARNPGNLEVRLIDQPIPFGLYGMNINETRGKMYVKQYEYRAKTDGIRFILTPKDDYWYDVYRQQLMSLWEDAKLA